MSVNIPRLAATTLLRGRVVQLKQVEQLLLLTPNDKDLLALRDDLLQLQQLTKLDEAKTESAAAWRVGDRCIAVYPVSVLCPTTLFVPMFATCVFLCVRGMDTNILQSFSL